MSSRKINVRVYGKPPGVAPDINLETTNKVTTKEGTFLKLHVGWVGDADGSGDGEVVRRFWDTGKLPFGVSLEYSYSEDRRGY